MGFKFYVLCNSYTDIGNLITDYVRQYPDEILKVSRRFNEIIQTDNTVIQFIASTNPDKYRAVHEDIIFEDGFREMYQIRWY